MVNSKKKCNRSFWSCSGILNGTLIILASGVLSYKSAQAQFSAKKNESTRIVAPFGFPIGQPPDPGSVITLTDHEIGFETQQVCGYTDWSTLQLKLPRQLLSKEYWRDVGSGLVTEAQRLAMSLTGALPSMLACNASPTFCHVFNQAEHMAALEGQLTFETCQMLDGLANVSHLQGEGLRNCISNQMGRDSSLSASAARERCLTNSNSAGLSKGAKVGRTAALSDQGDSFKMAEFIDTVFPTSVHTSEGSRSLSTGVHAYSRAWKSRDFMTDLFPGVEVGTRSSVMRGGTFNSVSEKAIHSREKRVHDKIRDILIAMKPHYDRGEKPEQIAQAVKASLEDKNAWRNRKEPSVLHRSRSDGGEPVLLVTPEQLVMLLPLADQNEASAEKSIDTVRLRQVIDRLAAATAHVQVQDMLADIYGRTLDRCKRDPKYQTAVAQENCSAILERTKGEMEILAQRRDAEESARRVQVEIAAMVQAVQMESLASAKHRGREIPSAPINAMPIPGKF